LERTVANRVHSDEQVTAFMAELEKQTDRGVGIVAASVVESALQELIQRRLVSMSNTRLDLLFGRMRPLSSFAAKIELGSALGLYSDRARLLLNMLRDVRNAFAHEMNAIGFDAPEIAKLVEKAKTPNAPSGPSTRETFINLFYAVIGIFYAVGVADIRIKPLSETHGDLYLALSHALLSFAQQQASAKKE
jgi:hypothetical protein